MSEKTTLGENGIYDARSLGVPKMLLLGLQHMFAMFGATILVPMLTGLDVSTTLLFAGLGTLLFHLLTKRKVPAFLGSSFAFLGGYAAIAPMADGADNSALLPYACFGVACAGLLYLVLSLLIKISFLGCSSLSLPNAVFSFTVIVTMFSHRSTTFLYTNAVTLQESTFNVLALIKSL